ncbi:hypothetical protein BH11MYX4_BH11MYX4_00370 [soil metagenome]
MLLESLRAARRRRTRTFAALSAGFVLAAAAVACGIDAVATKEFPGLEAGLDAPAEVSLPPKPDGGVEDGGGPDASPDGPLACPTGHGPMVIVDAGGLLFCIDATEVRNDEYAKFVTITDGGKIDSGFDAGVPSSCAFNTTYARVGAKASDPADHPAAGMDWCDAYAYCHWAGKRLCGKQVANDASTGEWYAACTKGGVQPVPYGAAYDASACNDNTGSPSAVGSRSSCQGSATGIFDMNGNLSELVDNCTATGCTTMGGYFGWPGSVCATDFEYPRPQTDPTIGFRCCADPR